MERGFSQAKQCTLPLIKADLITATAECPICYQEINFEPQCDTNSRGWVSYSVVNRLYCFYPWRWILCFHWIETCYGYTFASMKITLCGLKECLMHSHDIPHSFASLQWNHSIAKQGQQWVCAHWSFVLLSSHHSEPADLIEQPLKTKLWCQMGDNSLKGWSSGSVIQDEIYVLNQCSI